MSDDPPPPATSTRNIQSSAADRPSWDSTDLDGSLDNLYRYVVQESKRSEDWYWKRKSIKARGSHAIQWTAVGLTGLAAMMPIAIQLGLFPGLGSWLSDKLISKVDSGLIASLCIGLSAALIAFDRVSGLSSGWARYVLTGTAIRSACEEFRMDWTALRSQLSATPTADQIAAMVQCAKTFRMAVEALVAKETQDWATEFQNNLAQMEKELKGQVEQARTAREKAGQELRDREDREKERAKTAEALREAAQQPGSVEATVMNAADTDGFKFDAALENGDRTFKEPIESSQTWARIEVPPGQYKLTVRAEVKKRPVVSMVVIAVKPGETTKAQLTLPVPPP